MCQYKRFNLITEDFFSSHLYNRRFIKEIFFTDSDKIEEQKDIKKEECTNLWSKAHPKDKKKKFVKYLCLKTTTNFLDPELIVDVKVKHFENDTCKPEVDYNERKYKCFCDLNLAAIAADKTKAKRFLCFARKTLK